MTESAVSSPFDQEAFFDEMYRREGFSYAAEPSQSLKDIASGIAPPATALDLGCGDGRAAIYLAQKQFSVTAVDLSLVGLEKLRRMADSRGVGQRIETVHADVRSVALKSESFDLITAVTILDHLPAEDVAGTLRKWISFLTPDGWIHLQVHLVDDPGSTHNGDPESESAPAVQHYFNKGELRKLVDGLLAEQSYREFREEDTSHGPLHYHSFAELAARKQPGQLRLI